jgi:hypothetical protein
MAKKKRQRPQQRKRTTKTYHRNPTPQLVTKAVAGLTRKRIRIINNTTKKKPQQNVFTPAKRNNFSIRNLLDLPENLVPPLLHATHDQLPPLPFPWSSETLIEDADNTQSSRALQISLRAKIQEALQMTTISESRNTSCMQEIRAVMENRVNIERTQQLTHNHHQTILKRLH